MYDRSCALERVAWRVVKIVGAVDDDDEEDEDDDEELSSSLL